MFLEWLMHRMDEKWKSHPRVDVAILILFCEWVSVQLNYVKQIDLWTYWSNPQRNKKVNFSQLINYN